MKYNIPLNIDCPEDIDYETVLKDKFIEIYTIDVLDLSIEQIFSLCLGFIHPFRQKWMKWTTRDNKDLLKLLTKNDLEDYESMLTEQQHRWISKDTFSNPQKVEERKKGLLEHKIQIVELLMLVKEDDNLPKQNNKIDITIKRKGVNHKFNFNDFAFFNKVASLLRTQIDEFALFHTYLPPKESKECIINSVDPVWNLKIQNTFNKSDFNLEIDPPCISWDIIKKYALEHPIKPKRITLEMLESKYESLKAKQKEQNKPGARDKNSRLARLALNLSYLYNFKTYWNQNEIKSIYDFPITNEIYRFVYDYLNIWGLIETQNIYTDKELKTNYTKALVKQLRNKTNFEYDKVKFHTEFEIDLLHKIKYGEAELDEFERYRNKFIYCYM
jgi:hypothetical protein